MALESADTPALLVDLDALDANIAHLAAVASSRGVRARPHAKTHRFTAIALKQVEAGAVGICCQKVGEAEAMAYGGIKDILISNEVWGGAKLARIAALARQVRLAVCVDNANNVADLSEAAAVAHGAVIDVLVEIDVIGDVRCGVPPGGSALALARAVARHPGLRLTGIQAYAGAAQHVREYSERKTRVELAAHLARETKELLEQNGLECPCVTGSGTGTCEVDAGGGVFTELQAGSYVFMDADYGKNLAADGKPDRTFQQSLFVYSTVMSRPTKGSGVLDAGTKSSSFDSGPPAVCGISDVESIRGSDEHSVVTIRGGHFPYELGEKVRLIPGHCDPTVNMYDWYVGCRAGRVAAVWPVAARGLNRR